MTYTFEEVEPGDRVTLLHDNGDTASITTDRAKGKIIGAHDLTAFAEVFGWTITHIEKPLPPLPTERGSYRDKNGLTWELDKFWNCNAIGTTADASDRLNAKHGPFTLIEKAAPTLPTEPGSYMGADGRPWRLGVDGSWHRLDGIRYTVESATRYAPFTRLEPVADTARKVLDFIGSSWELGAPSNVLSALKDAATEFGVVYE